MILNISGKKIKSFLYKSDIINVTDLVNGIYFIQLITDERTITKKFVKQ